MNKPWDWFFKEKDVMILWFEEENEEKTVDNWDNYFAIGCWIKWM